MSLLKKYAFICLVLFSIQTPLSSMALGQSDFKLPKVTILTSIKSFPYNERTDQESVINFIKNFMDQTGLDYEIKYMIWNRAFSLGKSNKNTLLFETDKTELRANLFHWILPIRSDTLNFITTKQNKINSLTKEEILSGKFTTACGRDTSPCFLIKEFGLPDSRIHQLPFVNDITLSKMLLNKRTDFVIGNFKRFLKNVQNDINPNQFTTILDDITVSTYLAANINTDPEILKILQDTAKKYPAPK